MKKTLFRLFIPSIFILPLTLFSCSQNADNTLNQIKGEIQSIINLKPEPTFKDEPIINNNELKLTSKYLDNKSYIAPTEPSFKFVNIEINWIEFPVLDSSDLVIWLKVLPKEYPGEDVEKFYSINFSDLVPSETKIISFDQEDLKLTFEKMIDTKKREFDQLINDAVNGAGLFNSFSSIKPSEYVIKLPERLTAMRTNTYIFNGHQNNVEIEYSVNNNEVNPFSFKIYLGKKESSNPIFKLLEVKIIDGGVN